MLNQHKNFSIVAFFVGGILGASAALLFSPRSGKELRSNIKRQTDEYLKEAKFRRDFLINKSRSTGELLKRKAEDLMENIKNYTNGKIERPFFLIEKEIAGLRSAINAARASYSGIPEIQETQFDGDDRSPIDEYEDELLPKHLGMGKGRSRKSFNS